MTRIGDVVSSRACGASTEAAADATAARRSVADRAAQDSNNACSNDAAGVNDNNNNSNSCHEHGELAHRMAVLLQHIDACMPTARACVAALESATRAAVPSAAVATVTATTAEHNNNNNKTTTSSDNAKPPAAARRVVYSTRHRPPSVTARDVTSFLQSLTMAEAQALRREALRRVRGLSSTVTHDSDKDDDDDADRTTTIDNNNTTTTARAIVSPSSLQQQWRLRWRRSGDDGDEVAAASAAAASARARRAAMMFGAEAVPDVPAATAPLLSSSTSAFACTVEVEYADTAALTALLGDQPPLHASSPCVTAHTAEADDNNSNTVNGDDHSSSSSSSSDRTCRHRDDSDRLQLPWPSSHEHVDAVTTTTTMRAGELALVQRHIRAQVHDILLSNKVCQERQQQQQLRPLSRPASRRRRSASATASTTRAAHDDDVNNNNNNNVDSDVDDDTATMTCHVTALLSSTTACLRLLMRLLHEATALLCSTRLLVQLPATAPTLAATSTHDNEHNNDDTNRDDHDVHATVYHDADNNNNNEHNDSDDNDDTRQCVCAAHDRVVILPVPRHRATCTSAGCRAPLYVKGRAPCVCRRCGQLFCDACCSNVGIGPYVHDHTGRRCSLGWERLCTTCWRACERYVVAVAARLCTSSSSSSSSSSSPPVSLKDAVLCGTAATHGLSMLDGGVPFYVYTPRVKDNTATSLYDSLTYTMYVSHRRLAVGAGATVDSAAHTAQVTGQYATLLARRGMQYMSEQYARRRRRITAAATATATAKKE